MFPSAHTACSHTFWWGEWRSLKNNGTASTQTERERMRGEQSIQIQTELTKSKQVDPVNKGLSKQLTGFDHCLCLCRRPWCNVGQSPGSFKLQWRTDEERERNRSSDVFEVVVNNTSPLTTLNTKWPSGILWKGLSKTFPQDSAFAARTDLYKYFLKKYTTVLASFWGRHEDKSNDFSLSQSTVTQSVPTTIVWCIFMIFSSHTWLKGQRSCWGFPFVYQVPNLISH